MSDKKTDNKTEAGLPDISGIFDIDEKKIPDKIIKKDPEDDKKIENPILTSDEARKSLPKEDRKILKKEDKEKNRERIKIKITKKLKKNIAIGAAVIAVILAIVLITGSQGNDTRLQEVFVSAPTVESVSAYYTLDENKAFTTNDHLGKLVAFFDNKYDTHGLKEGLTASITTASGKTIQGTIVRISQLKVTDPLVTNYYEQAEGKKATTDQYAVYIQPDTSKDLKKYFDDGFGEIIPSVVVTTQTVENALTVPTAALIVRDSGTEEVTVKNYFVLVYSEKKGTVKRVPVTVGIEEGDITQITSGLEADAKIVTACADELYDVGDFDDGTKVKVKE